MNVSDPIRRARDVAVEAARRAGRIARERFARGFAVFEKDEHGDCLDFGGRPVGRTSPEPRFAACHPDRRETFLGLIEAALRAN